MSCLVRCYDILYAGRVRYSNDSRCHWQPVRIFLTSEWCVLVESGVLSLVILYSLEICKMYCNHLRWPYVSFLW